MKNILLIGAGRSASTLIKYLLDNSGKENWKITVADISVELAKQKTNNHSNAHAIALDINNEEQRVNEIGKVVAEYYRQKDYVLDLVEAGKGFDSILSR